MLQRMLKGAAVAQRAEEAAVSSTTLYQWRRDSLTGRMADDEGARLTATPLYELRRRGGRFGIVSMCIGGGMGTAGLHEIVCV